MKSTNLTTWEILHPSPMPRASFADAKGIWDEDGEVKDVKFISFEKLMDEDSGALDNLLVELDDAGLLNDFETAIGGFLGALIGIIIEWKGAVVLGTLAGPAGWIVASGAAVYATTRALYWNGNENTVDTIQEMIT